MSRRRHLSAIEREHIAENMKERVYATITLLAVIAAHWQHEITHSVQATVISIIGTVVALWLATLIAMRMSHRAVHGKAVELHEYRRLVFTSSGLLAPAIGPTLIVLGSLTGLYTLKNALIASVVVLLLSLFLLSFTAGRRIYDSTARLFIVSFLEMSVGLGVIALKILVGE